MVVPVLVAIAVVLVLLVIVLLLPAQETQREPSNPTNVKSDYSIIEHCKKVNKEYERLFQTNDFRYLAPIYQEHFMLTFIIL